MTFEQAKELLSVCQRDELRDHAFGDREVSWYEKDTGRYVVEGYFSGTSQHIEFTDSFTSFEGSEANALGLIGTARSVERNDETGPAEFKQGVVMSRLTREFVRQELED